MSTKRSGKKVTPETVTPPPDPYECPELFRELGIDGQLVQELKTSFEFFDRVRKGMIGLGDGLLLFRSLGEQVTQSDVDAEFAGAGGISFSAFVAHESERLSRPSVTNEQLRGALHCFERDGAAGLVMAEELIGALTSAGEPFSKEEADQFLRDCGSDRRGYIDCAAFSSKIVPPATRNPVSPPISSTSAPPASPSPK